MLSRSVLLKNDCSVRLRFPLDARIPAVVCKADGSTVATTLTAKEWDDRDLVARTPARLLAFALARAAIGGRLHDPQSASFREARALTILCYDHIFMRVGRWFHPDVLSASALSLDALAAPLPKDGMRDRGVFSLRGARVDMKVGAQALEATVSFRLHLREGAARALRRCPKRGTNRVPVHEVLLGLGVPLREPTSVQSTERRTLRLSTLGSLVRLLTERDPVSAPPPALRPMVFRTEDGDVPRLAVDVQTLSVANEQAVPVSARVVVDEAPFESKVRTVASITRRVPERRFTLLACPRTCVGRWADCLRALGTVVHEVLGPKDADAIATRCDATRPCTVVLASFRAIVALNTAHRILKAGLFVVDDAHAADAAAHEALRRVQARHRQAHVALDLTRTDFARLWNCAALVLPHITIPVLSVRAGPLADRASAVAPLLCGRLEWTQTPLSAARIAGFASKASNVRRVVCAPTERGRRVLAGTSREERTFQDAITAVHGDVDTTMRCVDWEWRRSPPQASSSNDSNDSNGDASNGEVCPMCFDSLHGRSSVINNRCGHRVCVKCWETQCTYRNVQTCCMCRGEQSLGHTLQAVRTPDQRPAAEDTGSAGSKTSKASKDSGGGAAKSSEEEDEGDDEAKEVVPATGGGGGEGSRSAREHYGPLTTKLEAVAVLARNAVVAGTRLFVFADAPATRLTIEAFVRRLPGEHTAAHVAVWPYAMLHTSFRFPAASKCILFDTPPANTPHALPRLRANNMGAVLHLVVDWSRAPSESDDPRTPAVG